MIGQINVAKMSTRKMRKFYWAQKKKTIIERQNIRKHFPTFNKSNHTLFLIIFLKHTFFHKQQI